MIYPLFSPATSETSAVAAGKLSASIADCQKKMQTGVLEIDFRKQASHHLIFARGQLVNIYQHASGTTRLDPSSGFQSLAESNQKAHLRALALTPQAVRLVKILLEQTAEPAQPLPENFNLEGQFENWMTNPVPALAHLRWPNAEALALLPGENSPPNYTLFASASQIFHSAGGMMALYGWKESCVEATLLSSAALTPAWEEYLMHFSFSRVVQQVLERLIELTSPVLVNPIIRELNFTSAAHGWNINLNGTSVTDQTIFSTPGEAAQVYSRLFEVLFRYFESLLGADLPELILRETILHLSPPCRTVMQEYLLIASL